MSRAIAGRKLRQEDDLSLTSNGVQVTRPCVDCSITVGAESTDVRAITIQLKDAYGNDIAYKEEVELLLYTTSAMDAYATTGGSTGLAIGTDGALQLLLAKKRFVATSEADGDIDLTWTDNGTEPAFLGVKLPTGRIVISSALTNS